MGEHAENNTSVYSKPLKEATRQKLDNLLKSSSQ